MYEKELKAFEDYLTKEERKRKETVKSYVLNTKLFLEQINKQPKNINKTDIDKWKKHCSKYHNNSLTPKYASIKKFINYLVDKEILDDSMESIVRRRLRAPKQQYDEEDISRLVMTPEEYKQVFDQAKKRNPMHYAMFKTMFWGTLRRCEVIGLKISDIDFKNKKLRIREEIAKGGKRATINLAQECLDILEHYIQNTRDKPKKEKYKDILFLRNGWPLSKTKMWEIHRLYSEKLGFYITSHNWRHTGITEYAKVEKDPKIVQKQARHDDINITMRYINYTSETYEKSYHEKFAKQIQEKPEPKPIKAEPQDNYIAQVPEQITVEVEDYKKFLEWKRQQDMMYG